MLNFRPKLQQSQRFVGFSISPENPFGFIVICRSRLFRCVKCSQITADNFPIVSKFKCCHKSFMVSSNPFKPVLRNNGVTIHLILRFIDNTQIRFPVIKCISVNMVNFLPRFRPRYCSM